MTRKPNVLILMPDQQRADCLSCAGHPVVQTPNMDRLAAEGTRFSRAYTTCPICMPARSSFLSGLYCHNHGQWSNLGSLPPNAETYPRHAKAAGYHTCHIGKSHLYPHRARDHLRAHEPFMHGLGWDDVLETTGPHATRATDSIMTDHWRDAGCLQTFRDDYRKREQARWIATWPSPMPTGETLDDFVGRTAVEYLSAYDRPGPFLVFVGFGGPHEPWDPPAEWAAKYDPSKMNPAKPVTEPDEWTPPQAAEHQRRLQNPNPLITPEILASIRALYYGKISHIDWWIGRILDLLERRGLLQETAIILWSDHGEMLGDKGRWHKSVFYEESVRVPLIVRPPAGGRPGSVSNSLVSIIDVFPTILGIAGCGTEPRGFGRSLLPLLADPEKAIRGAVFSEYDNRTMILTGEYKMVVNSAGTLLKLYNVGGDPEENVNLAGHPGTANVVARLRDRMLDWHLATQYRQQ